MWLLWEWGHEWHAVANLQGKWDVIEFYHQKVGGPTKICAVAVNVVTRERETDTLGEWHHVMNCHK